MSPKKLTSNHYDLIVIGTGMGGLTVASLMSQYASKRVLLLEKHFKSGGLTHTFRRHQWEWDVGLHYVGGMKEGCMTRRFMDYVTGSIPWEKIPDPFENFIYPDFHFEVSSDLATYRESLKKEFPNDVASIDRYFRDIRSVQGWSSRWFASKQTPGWIGSILTLPGRSRALQTTKQYFDHNIKNRQLQGVLASQWGDYGLPPMHSAFAIHAAVTADYFLGGWYPSEGASAIAKGAIAQVEKHGGSCLVSHEVSQIIIENGKAVGVRCVNKGESIEFRAPCIVSNAGALSTLKHLLPPEHVPAGMPDLAENEVVPTAVTLYLGLSDSPATQGFNPGNYWISDSYDHDDRFSRRNHIADGEIHHAYLSFPSMRTPKSEHHVAEIICFADFESWSDWKDQPWKRRGPEYEARKELVANAIIDFVEKWKPGLKSLIRYSELSTPLSVSSLSNHGRGAIYGYPATPERYRKRLFHAKSPVRNLYLTGSDVGSVGINGALMGGVMSTAAILGPLGFPKLIRQAYRPSRMS